MPLGLRHVISGSWLGDPWFPHGAVLLPSPACMTLCVFVFLFLCLVSCLCLAILGCDDTMLPSPAWIHQWTGCQSFSCVRFWFCSGFVFCFAFFGLVWCAFAVCLVDDDDGLLDYVQVLHQFSFVALNSRWPWILICNYCFCNVI